MAASQPAPDWPAPQLLIPDLLRQMPIARAVLDRHGLRGCGGPAGPHESLATFAQAHDVPLDQLLAEIRDATQTETQSPAAKPSREEQLADTIYRPFFLSGIGVALTLGAAWGVLLLVRIGFGGSFAAVSLHEVNAHGHAQIFGWVGLFVMGFAYQAFARFKHTDLAWPRLAWASWGLMLAGLAGRSLLEPLVNWQPGLGIGALAASGVEVVAIGVFVAIIVATLRKSARLESYDYYVLSALFWFVVQAVWETAYFGATLAAPDREHLLNLVATWQGPLREIQIHGFAMLMILGVSQRIFHYFFGLRAPNSRKAAVALVVLNVAVAGEVAGLVLMRTAGHAWALLWYGSVLALAAAAAVLVADWHIFAGVHESDRSLKFLRTAYVWLFISLGMLVLLPVYQYAILPALAPQSGAAQIGFSHAYYGAIRHAITVGFISLMIVGVAAKVIPTLRGIDVRSLGGLWVPFVLVNLGCGLRVVFQTLTDLTPSAYPIAGISGLFELTGLAIWGIPLAAIMLRREEAARPADAADDAKGTDDRPITGDDRVGEVLDRCPWLLDAFVAAGFKPLRSAALRRTLARRVTVRYACGMVGVDLDPFLESLNAARRPAACHSHNLIPVESITPTP